jgi:hypothetical protein
MHILSRPTAGTPECPWVWDDLADKETAMIVTLGQTANFVIQYENTFSDGLRRAQALKSSCESDFAQMRAWFSATGGFGASNRITLLVDNATLAYNNSYQTGGATKVVMNPFDGYPNKNLADDGTRALFVAEVVEVLMSYQNFATANTTWHPGWSDGEGLSRVSAALLYQDAYYQLLGAPFINIWLQSSTRTDYITTPEQTDQDATSFGCSILFIYYLYSQLGIDLISIVSKAGATLEATYEAVTGLTDGYNALAGLLSRFFPAGETPWLPFDNPFPLVDGLQRSVYVTTSEQATGSALVASSGSATISAGGQCPKKTYTWTLSNVSQQLTCTAAVTGFGQPVFSWRINGEALSFSGNIDVTATVKVDDPNNPDQPAVSTQSVPLFYSAVNDTSTYEGLTGELAIDSQSFPGHIMLVVEADVKEQYASTDVTTGSGLGTLDTQELAYDSQYYKDRAACLLAIPRQFGVPQPLAEWVYILLTLPDPPPEVMNGATVLAAVASEIAAISATRPEVGQQIAAAVAGVLNVPVQMLLTGTVAGQLG